MEQFIVSLFGDFSIIAIPFVAGITCSFIIEAINQITPEWLRARFIVPLVCFIVGVFLIFAFPHIVQGWIDSILIVTINLVFAIVFYKFAGTLVVQKIIGKAVNVVSKKTDE
ncbi:MAG: hypothetical protein RBR74_06735 [Ignavibacteriaceae bacterium]|jgi:hypothetical protein|nr:hypothetical protein [Ignavibacteriaceae bacterium]